MPTSSTDPLRRPRSLLVTGGAGFIGCNYVRFVLGHDPGVRIVTLDALTYAGNLENLRDLPDTDRHTFVRGDICDADLVADLIRQHQVDTIVNFAAESHVDRSIAGPAPFVQTNVVGTFRLLEAARDAWLPERVGAHEGVLFHHVSTDEVYGSLDPGAPAFRETSAYAPSSPYAASKAAADHLVRAHAHTYGLPTLITNCSNNYGPFQFPEKLIPLVVLNALAGEPLPIYGDGGQVRDWLFVEDHCRALWMAACRAAPGETYNIGGGVQPTNLEVVQEVCTVLDGLEPDSPHAPHAALIRFVSDRPGHDRRYAIDSEKIRRDLGWSPRHTLADGLRRTVAWYLENPTWVGAIRRRPDVTAWYRRNYGERGERG